MRQQVLDTIFAGQVFTVVDIQDGVEYSFFAESLNRYVSSERRQIILYVADAMLFTHLVFPYPVFTVDDLLQQPVEMFQIPILAYARGGNNIYILST